jgi:hypothetical protein
MMARTSHTRGVTPAKAGAHPELERMDLRVDTGLRRDDIAAGVESGR